MTAGVTNPNEAELNWIDGNVAVAEAIASAYGIEERPLAPAQLDEIWSRWMGGETLGIDDPNQFINAVGLALGTHLAAETGLQWKVIEDEYGVEMALHAEPGDIRVFPANLVAKRFERGEGPFMAQLAAELVSQIRDVRER
jgi:hypothetical protein